MGVFDFDIGKSFIHFPYISMQVSLCVSVCECGVPRWASPRSSAGWTVASHQGHLLEIRQKTFIMRVMEVVEESEEAGRGGGGDGGGGGEVRGGRSLRRRR